MDTSRKIPEETVLLLDELQVHLKRRGINTNQKQIIDASIKFAARNEEMLAKAINQKPKKDRKEMTERFLKHAKKFDFGKNWLEEIDTAL